MTTIESREIRGISLRILYVLVSFSVVSTAGIMTSYFSLKNDNQLLSTQIEILKVQYKIIDQRLEKIENKKDVYTKQNARIDLVDNNNIPPYHFLAAVTGQVSKN